MVLSKSRSTQYLKSGEVAELLGVTKQTLLNWLRDGKILEPERNPVTGYRLWTVADVEQVRRMLRERHSDTAGNL